MPKPKVMYVMPKGLVQDGVGLRIGAAVGIGKGKRAAKALPKQDVVESG